MAAQRQIALRSALQPYREGGGRALLSPLPQETELANLLLYADFYTQDGQLTLIEQLRDVITEHIPQEEREWLDPLNHSDLAASSVACWSVWQSVVHGRRSVTDRILVTVFLPDHRVRRLRV